jgi:uncharacterized RDD family membrane protein YckC
VRTPEGIALPFLVASASDRLTAFTIDLAIIVGGTLASAVLALLVAAAGAPALGLSFALLASFLLRNAYFIVCEVRWNGRTIGKRRLGLRVISRDGGPLTTKAVLARNLTRDVEFFLPVTALLVPRAVIADGPGWALLAAFGWLFVFALLPLFGKDRLRCGDMVAGTLVVEAPVSLLLRDLALTGEPTARRRPRPDATASEPPSAAPEPAEAIAFTREQLDIYGVRELQVLEDVLRRFDQGTVQPDVLAEICRKIRRKIRWEAGEAKVPDRDFLAAFYRAQRARLEQRMLFGQRIERQQKP